MVLLCTAHFQVQHPAHANKPAKNRCVSQAETEGRAKAEPLGINISGNKLDTGLVSWRRIFFLIVFVFFGVRV